MTERDERVARVLTEMEAAIGGLIEGASQPITEESRQQLLAALTEWRGVVAALLEELRA